MPQPPVTDRSASAVAMPPVRADEGDFPEMRQPRGLYFALTRLCAILILTGFALVPLAAVGYLLYFQDPGLRFESHAFHEIAIGVAIVESAFITAVTWRCYLSSGEPFLRWLTLSFLGFTLIYAPHGLLTRMASHDLWLFLMYGPVSRFVMMAALFIGLTTYGSLPHPQATRGAPRFWGGWIVAFLGIDLLVAWLVGAFAQFMPILRLFFEYGALALALLGIGVLLLRRIRSPLMLLYTLALAFFAESSLAFVLAKAWDHLWWLAHAISAGGFLLLAYGVIRAFHTTRSFSLVFSQEELIAYLRAAKTRADEAARQLQRVNEELAHLAATDPLTGIANRRHFIGRAEAEIARSRRSGEPLALLALDLDHFKRINDEYGHAAGDLVLARSSAAVAGILRPSDLFGRMGGEEFSILLTGTDMTEAASVAERIRAAVNNAGVEGVPPVTASIGIAGHATDGDTFETLSRVADARLYQAKRLGRNRAVGDDASGAD